MRPALRIKQLGTTVRMLADQWTLADYDRADRISTDRIIKKQSRGSVTAQNGWYMTKKALRKQSKAADGHIRNLLKALEKASS